MGNLALVYGTVIVGVFVGVWVLVALTNSH